MPAQAQNILEKDSDLDYTTHLEYYKKFMGYYSDVEWINKDDALRQAENRAGYHHALCVFNPLRDLYTNAVIVGQQLTNENAMYYMLHGAGRRLGMIFFAFRTVSSLIYDNRKKPLSQEEQSQLTKDINIIYMNIRGVLDNYAWCLMFERQPELADTLHPNDIGLFNDKFRKKCAAFKEIKGDIIKHDAWNKEVKERRDPVAHRIPLFVPNAALTPEEKEQHDALHQRHSESLRKLELEEAGEVMDQMYEIGTFIPYFLHHPDGPRIPIYPTIPQDMAHLIRIGRTIETALLNKASNPRTTKKD